ncbi:MAG: HAD-IA family hydrolase [Armatimonadetes bacterium]|nr:HAD-IA family hydrolase [Armatimonadota bacterium]
MFDAREIHYLALNDALGEHGFNISRETHLRRFDGKTTRTKLQMLTAEQGLPPEKHDAIFESKQEKTKERFKTELKRDDSKVELIKALKDQGCLVAICSNAIRESVQIMSERIGIDGMLDLYLGNEDSPNPKPAPDIYLRGAELLGVSIHECAIVEDSATGILAAERAKPGRLVKVKGPEDVNTDMLAELLSPDPRFYADRGRLIDDIADFLGVSSAFVRPKVNYDPNHATEEGLVTVPNLWKWMYGHREGDLDEYRYFYTACFPYLFDLANFADQFDPHIASAAKYMKGRCLDYGSGIGTVGFYMSMLDHVDHVDLIDVNPVLNNFARWRARKYETTQVRVLDPTDTPTRQRRPQLALQGPYDFIYARDVLEHCIDRMDIVDSLIDALADGGHLCEATPIDDYDETTGKENVARMEYDIWELLQDRGFTMVSAETTGGFSLGTTKVWRKPENL